MPIDMELVAKGMQVSRKGLLDQALYHQGLEAKHRGALMAAGWTPENSAEFSRCLEFLKAQIHKTEDARAESRTDTQNEQAAITESKAFKRKLVTGMKDLHVEKRVLDADYDLVRYSGRLDRSTPKILAYFAKIRGQVEKYDALLTPYFGGTSALTIFNEVQQRLEAAQTVQEVNLKALPQETLKIYEAMGRMLWLIEKMNRIGRIAFDGQAAIIAEFNKDLILRARKTRSKSTVEPVTEQATEDTA